MKRSANCILRVCTPILLFLPLLSSCKDKGDESGPEDVMYPGIDERWRTEVREVPADYIPFIKEGKRWVAERYSDEGTRELVPVHSFLMQGDTIIEGKPGKKVFYSDKDKYNDESWHYFATVFEENMLVSMIRADETEREFLYDFSWKVNEFIRHENEAFRVIGFVDSEGNPITHGSSEGILRRFIYYEYIYYGSSLAIYKPIRQVIEGIGSNYGPFMESPYDIFKCYEGDVCVFSSDSWEDFLGDIIKID